MTNPQNGDDEWPALPAGFENDPDLNRILFAAQVAEARHRRNQPPPSSGPSALETDLVKKNWDSEYELDKLFQTNVYETAKGAIQRSRDNADFVQKSATAVMAIYTGVLGYVFSVSEDKLLPLRGVVPALFLAGAIAFATAYLAFLSRVRKEMALDLSAGSNRDNQIARLRFYVNWVSAAINRRASFLRTAVVCLGVGAALLPAPFIAPPDFLLTNGNQDGKQSSGAQAANPTKAPEPTKTPAPTPTPIPFPTAQPNDPLQRQILYLAEAYDVIRQRSELPAKTSSEADAEDGDVPFSIGLFLVGLAVVLVLGRPWVEPKDDDEDDGGGSGGRSGPFVSVFDLLTNVYRLGR